jgi:hypothetical protein
MKNLLLLLSFAAVTCPAMAQNEPPKEIVTDTVSIVSGPMDSLCNTIFKTEGCSPGSEYGNVENTPQKPGYKEITAMAWTYNQGNCPKGWVRSLLHFNGINNIPQNAIITKAEMKLFGWQNPAISSTVGNSYYPGSPYISSGSNEMLIKRITQPVHYPTVTWNTQPATDTPAVVTRPSQAQYGDDLVLDVARLVQDMVARQEFYGFMMMLQDETLYRAFGFHSCFAENPAKRPQLYITYTTVSVGVNNVLNENYLEIYPQPAGDMAYVEYVANTSADVQYSLYDMRGVRVAQGEAQATTGRNSLQLQLANLPSGVYVFTMTDGRSQLRKRIVKQ